MKKTLRTVGLGLLVGATLASCQKISTDEEASNGLTNGEIEMIAKAGFNSGWAEKMADGNYLVEGDMMFTKAQLQEMSGIQPTHEFIIASEEHYRTTNIVSTPTSGSRVITVSLGAGFPSYYSAGLDAALSRYNTLGLKITFQRVSSGADIAITGSDLGTSGGGCILGRSAGFPTSAGNPAPGFTLSTSSCATTYINSAARADEVMAHEIGHAIGFRHTDYMNRASCGTRSNEGSAGVGAIWISNTPKSVKGNYNSWMMACTNGDPSFSSVDNYALQYVY